MVVVVSCLSCRLVSCFRSWFQGLEWSLQGGNKWWQICWFLVGISLIHWGGNWYRMQILSQKLQNGLFYNRDVTAQLVCATGGERHLYQYDFRNVGDLTYRCLRTTFFPSRLLDLDILPTSWKHLADHPSRILGKSSYLLHHLACSTSQYHTSNAWTKTCSYESAC